MSIEHARSLTRRSLQLKPGPPVVEYRFFGGIGNRRIPDLPPGLHYLGARWDIDAVYFARRPWNWLHLAREYAFRAVCRTLHWFKWRGFLDVPEGERVTVHARSLRNWHLKFWQERPNNWYVWRKKRRERTRRA